MSHAQPTPPQAGPAPAAGRTLGRWFTQARREGLLSSLTPEAWQTLSAVLSFTTHDGRRLFTLDQLALALGTDRHAAAQRLADLEALEWNGAPLLTPERDGDGEVTGAALAPLELLAQVLPPADGVSWTSEGRAPEEDVPDEADRDETADDELADELEALGLTGEQIDWLTGRYEAAQIRRQLRWLPARGARNPAAMLIRAVEGDWAPPRSAG